MNSVTRLPDAAASSAPASSPSVDVVVPVHNEQGVLTASIRRLHDYLADALPLRWRIVIADNASTDETLRIAMALAEDLPGVELLALTEKGRGRALRAAWERSEADVVCYMDADLSTDLRALPPLLAPLLSGHSDVAIGTRLASGSRVVRGRKREFISRGYNRLLHTVLVRELNTAQVGLAGGPLLAEARVGAAGIGVPDLHGHVLEHLAGAGVDDLDAQVETQARLALGHVAADLVQVEVEGPLGHLGRERAGGRGRVGRARVAVQQLAADQAGARNADAGAGQIAEQPTAGRFVHRGLLHRGRRAASATRLGLGWEQPGSSLGPALRSRPASLPTGSRIQSGTEALELPGSDLSWRR